jgi:hypothetical protein
MVENISEIVNNAVSAIREFVAVWHYVSDTMALLEIIQLISAHGAVAHALNCEKCERRTETCHKSIGGMQASCI